LRTAAGIVLGTWGGGRRPKNPKNLPVCPALLLT